MTAAPNPSTLGQNVLLIASIAPAGSTASISATGTVQFSDGATSLGTVSVGNNAASSSLPTLLPASTRYRHLQRRSGYLRQHLRHGQRHRPGSGQPDCTHGFTHLSPYGSIIILTATVTSSVTGLSGSVTFFNGTASLGNVPLSGSTATFSTSAFSPGTHTLTAMYSGDTTHNPATSSSVAEVINDAASSVNLSATPSPRSPSRSSRSALRWLLPPHPVESSLPAS
ncbi:MAG: Ig-like domain-containing protein [Janthinobacterium lividum]